MNFNSCSLATAAVVVVLVTAVPCPGADGEASPGFERVWSNATLYENENNRYLQEFSLTGRLQLDSAWFDADQGQFDDAFIWRRFRIGFTAQLFRDWGLSLEGDFDLNESLGDSYTRLTDAYIGWSSREDFELKILKQSVGFTLDGATSSEKLLTMQRNNLSNNFWFTSEYFTGINAEGKIAPGLIYEAGAFSSSVRESRQSSATPTLVVRTTTECDCRATGTES